MTNKSQKIISTSLLAITVVGGFQILIYILNLNQHRIYFQVSFWIFLYLIFKIVFLFDLHFKNRGSWQRAKRRHHALPVALHRNFRVITSALWDRFEHLRSWEYISQWLHFLLLPGFIFWSSISLFYNNQGFFTIQQTVAALSSLALIVYYWFLKEQFYRRKEIIDGDIFTALAVVKIYAAGALFAAALSMMRYICLNPNYFTAEVFCYSFLLIYESLYLHRLVTGYTIIITTLIAIMMAVIGYLVYVLWGYNYFTAAVFMTAAYNLFWGVFHYRLDRALTKQTFIEVLLISLLVAAMVISVTNFKARILDGCNYRTGQIQ